MEGSEELRARLKSVEGELSAARKVADERVRLLRKVEERNEAAKVKAHRLAKEKEKMEASKKDEEEAERLRREL